MDTVQENQETLESFDLYNTETECVEQYFVSIDPEEARKRNIALKANNQPHRWIPSGERTP